MTFDPMGYEMPDPDCRYVCESGSDEWLAKRRQYVTASDVAVLHDISPYGLSFHVPLEAEGIFSPGHMVQVKIKRAERGSTRKFSGSMKAE